MNRFKRLYRRWIEIMKKFRRRILAGAPKKRLWFTKASYQRYLLTSHWRAVRAKKLKSAGHRCQQCKTKNTELHVHHRHYKTLWREKNRDLKVLCVKCHKAEHLGWK